MKKKIYRIAAVAALTFAAFTTRAAAITRDSTGKAAIVNIPAGQKQARLEEIKARVAAIRAMDKSRLTREERRELRRELRADRKEASAMSSGIYLSAGGIVAIILLLLLLL